MQPVLPYRLPFDTNPYSSILHFRTEHGKRHQTDLRVKSDLLLIGRLKEIFESLLIKTLQVKSLQRFCAPLCGQGECHRTVNLFHWDKFILKPAILKIKVGCNPVERGKITIRLQLNPSGFDDDIADLGPIRVDGEDGVVLVSGDVARSTAQIAVRIILEVIDVLGRDQCRGLGRGGQGSQNQEHERFREMHDVHQ